MAPCFSQCIRSLRMRPLAACLGLAIAAGGVGFPWVDASANTMLSEIIGSGHSAKGAFATGSGMQARAQAPAQTPLLKGVVIPVVNCDDSGTGSLRDAMGSASDGDTIDLTALACSEISLTTGQVTASAANVTINGPGADALAIRGGNSTGHNNRVIAHVGAGLLSINNVTITDAKYAGPTAPVGGCIASNGSVYLGHAVVTGCGVVSQSSTKATGGGIYAKGRLTAVHSTISNNSVFAPSANASGGGTYSTGILAMYSTIEKNVSNSTNLYGVGGGVWSANGDVVIGASIISGNHASDYIGGVVIHADTPASPYTAEIANSTVSGNSAGGGFGGIYTDLPLTMSNSTLAFNTAVQMGGGLTVIGGSDGSGGSLDLQNSIIANNVVAAGNPSDIEGVLGSDGITGAGNLVGVGGTLLQLPFGTVVSDPMLYPLADNGGPTRTHALMAGSPAIDAGINTGSLANDQRGAAYPRVAGARPDIGAFELQGLWDGDYIFVDGFDP